MHLHNKTKTENLLTLKMFQTHMNFFLLLNIKEYILKSVDN